jgi:DNA-binding CsgD family transcriptional regulator
VAHVVILVQFVLLLSSVLLSGVSFFVGRRDHPSYARSAGWLQLALASLLALDLALFYVGTNLLRSNPGSASGSGLYAPDSPLTFALNALLSAGIPMLVYRILCLVSRLSADASGSRFRVPARIVAAAMGAWLLAVNAGILATRPFSIFSRSLIAIRDAVTVWILYPAAIAASVFGLAAWLPGRKRVSDARLRRFGDANVAALILYLLSVAVGSFLVSIGIFGGKSGPAWSILMQGPMLPALVLDSSMAWLYSRQGGAPPRERQGMALAVLGCDGVPEGFYVRYRLTPRERAVCALLAQGLVNKEICRRLEVSHGTVKNHVSNIFAKLGVSSRFELLGRLRDFRPE